MQKLAEGDHEQRSVKQHTEQQTVELTKQIKVLQDQLLEVSERSLKTTQLLQVYMGISDVGIWRLEPTRGNKSSYGAFRC